MARFDEMLDRFIYKTKEIASNVGDKTSQVIETSRLKYRQNQVAEELEKSYMKLGVIVYEAKQNKQDFDTLIEKSVQDISLLNQRYDQLEESIALVGKADAVATSDIPLSMDEDDEILEDLGDIDCVVCNSELEDPLLNDSQSETMARGAGEKPATPITVEVVDTKEDGAKDTKSPTPVATGVTIDRIVAKDKPVEVVAPAEKAEKVEKPAKPASPAKHTKHEKKEETPKAPKAKEEKKDNKDEEKKKPEEPKK